ncbi:MAG: alcohol dehydrogenase catalytic domain-containing protein, partial [Nitrospinaceae bacterium]|nr:alcohol dehydrogenase catalytic domain-containing protein [Nitrospinaceae bacterium]NIR57397.1 alcohol dehydrogenase catalytic domain-containing protein [Nitrospinaceae bacterium]NIS87849.1 alcohol dehydrogenase catalytic domain-containing protein [Nitrospinaceae bacterium]NIT84720.1 alcohol dehydrogenase catalytic domain-containing protein [Nitrospinaceae bacterium]NIU46898.1 alcohol dehydrogenase catalytic domain-containing protein [Nitrospinaceae bacterium]
MTIRAYAAKNAIANLESYEYEPEPLGPFDVEIRVTHCGICHSDIHLIDNDWGITSYPLVPGHEIIGTVSDRGGAVSHLDEGMRVGVGWQRSACFQCDQCLRGCEHLCPQIQDTCVGYPGGFAEAIRIDSRFVFPIPDEFDSAAAAPLLCGG